MQISENLLIGMIHLPRLSLGTNWTLNQLIDYAITEVKKLEESNFNAAMIENFGDAPFQKTHVSDNVLIKLAIIAKKLREKTNLSLGINILRNASLQAFNIAHETSMNFIRSNVWEGAYVTDQGIIQGIAEKVIHQKNILNSKVKVFADIHVKHGYSLGNFDILESAENALYRGKADNIIVTGKSTGKEANLEEVKLLNDQDIKPIIGSGLNQSNIKLYEKFISGAIVGTSIKQNNIVTNPIDLEKAKLLSKEWGEFFS